MRSVRVKVPLSSANLGAGYDVLAAALGIHLTLTVTETGSFEVRMPAANARRLNRSNLCVVAFETVLPADTFRFEIDIDAPIGRGLGSSAAAIVAGLLAADCLGGGRRTQAELFTAAHLLERHPDNVAAAIYGGALVCSSSAHHFDGAVVEPVRLALPDDLAPVLAIPPSELATTAARAAIPADIPVTDAVHNLARIAELVLGLERADYDLIARGLADRIHQPRRATKYPDSYDLMNEAPKLGAVGATISGAGPTVMLWCRAHAAECVVAATLERHPDWIVRVTEFAPGGADTISGSREPAT